jgi:hypothetical protein
MPRVITTAAFPCHSNGDQSGLANVQSVVGVGCRYPPGVHEPRETRIGTSMKTFAKIVTLNAVLGNRPAHTSALRGWWQRSGRSSAQMPLLDLRLTFSQRAGDASAGAGASMTVGPQRSRFPRCQSMGKQAYERLRKAPLHW